VIFVVRCRGGDIEWSRYRGAQPNLREGRASGARQRDRNPLPVVVKVAVEPGDERSGPGGVVLGQDRGDVGDLIALDDPQPKVVEQTDAHRLLQARFFADDTALSRLMFRPSARPNDGCRKGAAQ